MNGSVTTRNTTPRSAASVACLCALWSAAFGWVCRPASAVDALEALVKAAEAKENVPLKAVGETIVRQRDGEQAMSLSYLLLQGTRGAFRRHIMTPVDLKDHLVISDGRLRWRILPTKLVAFRSQPQDFDAARQARIEAARKAPTFYTVRLTGKTTVAGRSGYVVQLLKDEVVRREVVLDTATFVELRNTLYGPEGQAFTTSQFTSVDFDVQPKPEDFSYTPGPEVLVAPEPVRPAPPRPPEEKPHVPFLRMPGPLAEGWTRPMVALPLYSGDQHPVAVVQWVFTSDYDDRPVFWFQKERWRKASFFDEFYKLDQVGSTPKEVATGVVVWTDGRVVYVLTGKIPAETLLKRANAFIAWPGSKDSGRHEHRRAGQCDGPPQPDERQPTAAEAWWAPEWAMWLVLEDPQATPVKVWM